VIFILIMIFRPTGIMGDRELRLPVFGTQKLKTGEE
jgi:hypothetical protein